MSSVCAMKKARENAISKKKRNKSNKKQKKTNEQQEQSASSWTGLRLSCETDLETYAAEAEAHLRRDLDAARTAFTEKAQSIAQMREAHAAELERREHLVMSFLVVFFIFLWFSSLSLVLYSVYSL